MDGARALALLQQQRKRMSQAELAEAIGVQPSTVSRWLGGHMPPGKSLSRLVEWAESLETPSIPSADVETAARRALALLQDAVTAQQRVVDLLRGGSPLQDLPGMDAVRPTAPADAKPVSGRRRGSG